LGRTAPVWRGHHLNFFPQEVSALSGEKTGLPTLYAGERTDSPAA
jgi:hypothetical protein